VPPKLVIRLAEPLPQGVLAYLQRDFADLLADGRIVEQDAVIGASYRPELAILPRLTFHFNRRSLIRLRQLINATNRHSS
jgi:hypothetical protein